MIPLADHNPTHRLPLVTWALIAACVGAFLWQVSGQLPFDQVVNEYGFIPGRMFGGISAEDDMEWFPTAPWVTVLTCMFLHGGWAHLGGNMLYLHIFGDNVENALGKVAFAAFYLLCGVAAALGQAMVDPLSIVPMVGASGAISGVLGAYLALYPRQRVTVLVPNVGVQQLPAMVVLGMWFAYQLLLGLADSGEGGVAFWAHIAGFAAGWLAMQALKPLIGARHGDA